LVTLSLQQPSLAVNTFLVDTLGGDMLKDTRPRTVVRARHDAEHHYFIVSRQTAQDPDLPLEALGLLAFLLSRPDTWRPNVRELARSRRCSKDKIARILRVLIARGYCRRTMVKATPGAHGGGRLVSVDYELFEERPGNVGKRDPVIPAAAEAPDRCPENRDAGFQDPGSPDVEITSPESTEQCEEHTPSPTGRGEEIGAVYAQETGGKTLRMSAEEERGAAELVAAEGPEVATRAYRLFLIDRMRRGTAIRFAYFLENVEQYIGRATAEPTEIWNVCAVGHRHRGEECQYCRDYTIAPADLASADEMADAFRGLAWRGAR